LVGREFDGRSSRRVQDCGVESEPEGLLNPRAKNSHRAAILVAMSWYRRLFVLAISGVVVGPAGAQGGVKSTLPNGRHIEPAGKWIPVAPYPFAFALRADAKQVAVPSIGFPFALNVIDDPASDRPRTERFPKTEKNDPVAELDAGDPSWAANDEYLKAF
jgi:hypothetical protein